MKALEQKVDPLLERFDAIFEIDISDENLDAIKTAVEGVAEAGDLLLALRKGGKGECELSVGKIQDKMAALVKWAGGMSKMKDFDAALGSLADSVGLQLNIPDDASSKDIAESFPLSLPTLPSLVDQAFLLQCCMAT